MRWNRVDRRGQKPGREASSDEQLPLEVEDKFTVRARELLAPQGPKAPFLPARTDPPPAPPKNINPRPNCYGAEEHLLLRASEAY